VTSFVCADSSEDMSNSRPTMR